MRRIANVLLITSMMGSSVLISCKKDPNDLAKNTCNVSNPVEELSWLKKEVENLKNDEYSYYIMAVYKGETVFINGNCNPAINYVSLVKNCNGDTLGYANALDNELSAKSIIWKSENYRCTL